MYRYETHMHTKRISKCGRSELNDCLDFYKKMGYDGVFITNHFIDGNINLLPDMTYEDKIRFYFSECELGKQYGKKIGLKVFEGVESSYHGTDFLIYGLSMEWFLSHPEIENMNKRNQLELFMSEGALVIQAHPYREASYIDHIRLYPRSVEGVEVLNSNRTDTENKMANIYADEYSLLKIAGSDNHEGPGAKRLAGMESESEIKSEKDFIEFLRKGKMSIFSIEL